MGRVIQVPGVVVANTATNMPTGTPPLRSIRALSVIGLTEGAPNTLVETTKTIVTAAPSAGEARLVGTGQWELGDATIASEYLQMDVEDRGSVIRA